MTLHDHWWLMAGIAVLYLFDSALLLFHNEIVLEAKRSGYLVSGGAAMELRSRHLFLPNPLYPHRPLIRLSWRVAEQLAVAGGQPAHWRRIKLALQVIAPWTWALFWLFFLVLPGVLSFGTDEMLLIWVLLIYGTFLAMLWKVWRHRKTLDLSSKAFAALAFDALLCAPFAINVVRKISLRQVRPSSLLAVASSQLSPSEKVSLCVILRQRIRTSLDFQEPDAAASDHLRAYMKHFEEGLS